MRTLKERLVRDPGEENVTAYEPLGSVHAPLLFKWPEPEGTEGPELLSRWVGNKQYHFFFLLLFFALRVCFCSFHLLVYLVRERILWLIIVVHMS